MTKKFIHTDKDINGSNVKAEFIIPDVINGQNSLIGIESQINYQYGKIVYTGIELDTDKILEKIITQTKFGFFKKRKIKKTLSDYLTQIKNLKVGDYITLQNDGKLKKVNNKRQYVKLEWKEDRLEGEFNWGHSIWYFELDFEGFPIRQLECYKNGKELWYSKDKLEDDFGGLGDQAILEKENEMQKITKSDFENIWRKIKN